MELAGPLQECKLGLRRRRRGAEGRGESSNTRSSRFAAPLRTIKLCTKRCGTDSTHRGSFSAHRGIPQICTDHVTFFCGGGGPRTGNQ